MKKATTPAKAASIDAYIADFPTATQAALQEVRTTISKAVPGAEETISYAIPAFRHNGRNLIYFAGYKNHIGMYPVPTGNEALTKEFAAYKTSGKGAIQFPLSDPMPTGLIKKIIQYRLKEQEVKASEKAPKKAATQRQAAK